MPLDPEEVKRIKQEAYKEAGVFIMTFFNRIGMKAAYGRPLFNGLNKLGIDNITFDESMAKAIEMYYSTPKCGSCGRPNSKLKVNENGEEKRA